MAEYLCIVAGQRTGTTALRSALASTGKFHNFGEIAQTAPTDRLGSFLGYAKERRIEVSEMATYEQAEAVARDYLVYLQKLAGRKIPLLDVKLNAWQIIRPIWGYVHQMPFFMEFLQKQGCTFLFIRRRDLVEQIVSARIASAANKWHGLEEKDIEFPISLGVDEVRNQARLILQSETFLLSCLRKASNHLITAEYEDIFVDGFVNSNLLSALREKMGVAIPSQILSQIKRNDVNKRLAVLNYEAVSKAIRGAIELYGRPDMKL